MAYNQKEIITLMSHEWQSFKRARTADGIWPQMRGLVKRGLIEVRAHEHSLEMSKVMASKGWSDLFQARLIKKESTI